MTAPALVLDPEQVRVAVYARQSKDKKVSISDQLVVAERRVARESHWASAGTFSDGVSASRHGRGVRADWLALLTLLEADHLDVVWLWEASRGDRNAATWFAFLDLCRAHGVTLYVEMDERAYDLRLPRDWKAMAETGVGSAYESDMIQRRTLRGKEEARRRGDLRAVFGGRARYGWQDTRDGWIVEPVAADLLRQVAARWLAGESLLAIHDDLAARLVDSYGRSVTYSRLRETLINPLVAGMLKPDQEGTALDKVTDGPLDPDTWRRVCALVRSRPVGRPANAYPLGKLLRCGKCGNQLSGDRSRGANPRPYYACGNAHPALGVTEPCGGTYVLVDDLHAVITRGLREWAETSPNARVQDVGLGDRRVKLEAELAFLQERQVNLDMKRDRKRITADGYAQADHALSVDFDRVERELAVVDQAEANPAPMVIDWDAATPDERRRMVAKVFVTPIVVQPYRAGFTTAEARVNLVLRPYIVS